MGGGGWRFGLDKLNITKYIFILQTANIYKTQVEIRDLSKYGSAAVARGQGLTFEDTTSPVDPGDRGKVAEAVDVCFPEKVWVRQPGCSFRVSSRGVHVARRAMLQSVRGGKHNSI